MSQSTIWLKCIDRLQDAIPAQKFNTWIRPLHAEIVNDELHLYAPNHFVVDFIKRNYIELIHHALKEIGEDSTLQLVVKIGNKRNSEANSSDESVVLAKDLPSDIKKNVFSASLHMVKRSSNNLNPAFEFSTFVEGNSNQLARAASLQVAQNPEKPTTHYLFMVGLD